MALNSSQQWWIRTDGSNTSGGGFDPDASEVVYNAVAQTLTLSARSGEGITATAGGGTPFGSSDVGKMIQDNTTGSYGLAQITAYTSATVVTVRILRPFLGVAIASNSWKLSDQINYCDQAAAQLTLTDLATSGAASTTLTSVTGGFTAAMIGNVIRISAGTNFQTGYYRITVRTDTNTVTLDRTPTSGGAGSGGSGKVGGAFLTFEPCAGTGNNGLNTPGITSPVAAGHTINKRGAGSDDPSSVDYDYKGTTTQGYWSVNANGSTTGQISLIGYNGRPLIQTSGLFLLTPTNWTFRNIKFKHVTSATFADYGQVSQTTSLAGIHFIDCICDLNGTDGTAFSAQQVIDCEVRNTGGGAAGTVPAIRLIYFPSLVLGSFIHDVRGVGITSIAATDGVIAYNVISQCGSSGISLPGTSYGMVVVNNTIDACTGSGILVSQLTAVVGSTIRNNIISNCGAYGISCSVGSVAQNFKLTRINWDYNNFYTNTSGNYNNCSAGANDTYVDPQYTNAGADNFSVGTNMKAIGSPGAFRGSTSTGYLDKGAVQRQEAGGSGGASPIGLGSPVIRAA